MIKRAVCTLITGRISEESLMFTIMIEICAQIGILTISLDHISMDAKMIIDASTVTAGKNSNIILEISKLIRVSNLVDAKKFIVLIITMIMIKEHLLVKISRFYLKTEEAHSVNLILI